MKICDTCGNELPDDIVTCPFCETRQSPQSTVHPPDAQTKSGKRHESSPKKAGKKSKTAKIPAIGDPDDSLNQQIMDLNLKAGKPRVDHALNLLDMKIHEAKLQGIKLIKVVHGWGSSGEGGQIKAALPSRLDELKHRRVIRAYLPGEKYSNTTPQGQHLISNYPELQSTIRPDRRNPGITLIEI